MEQKKLNGSRMELLVLDAGSFAVEQLPTSFVFLFGTVGCRWQQSVRICLFSSFLVSYSEPALV